MYLLIASPHLFTMLAVLQESKFGVLVLSYMREEVRKGDKMKLNGMDDRDS